MPRVNQTLALVTRSVKKKCYAHITFLVTVQALVFKILVQVVA